MLFIYSTNIDNNIYNQSSIHLRMLTKCKSTKLRE